MFGLTHYTRSIEAVENILTNGFAWVPNPRGLIEDLVPAHDFSEQEPQAFGMISFTDLPPPAPQRHLEHFGRFGIMVSCEWAESRNAQKVMYVSNAGPVHVCLGWLFTKAYEQLKAEIRFPDDGFARMVFTNKAMAGVQGGALWSQLLTLYEYLEPLRHGYQSEWRIVHPYPLYGYPPSKDEIIQSVSPPQGWRNDLSVLRPPDEAVIGFVCPTELEKSLTESLPSKFSSKPIYLYESQSSADLPY